MEIATILWLTTEIKILLFISFVIWCFVWIITTLGFRNKNINRADLFSVIVSCLWLFSLMAWLNISFWFDIMGAMSTAHLIWEKSTKTFLDFIIEYRLWWK